jgi:hypothetical protein
VKIIDRIIAQDGFEHILNVDYKTKRVGRSSTGNRGGSLDVVKMMQGDTAPTPVPAPALVAEPTTTMKARPVSMARGNSDTGEAPKVEEDKSTKRVSHQYDQ